MARASRGSDRLDGLARQRRRARRRSTWRRAPRPTAVTELGGAELEPVDRTRPPGGGGRPGARTTPTRRSSCSLRRPTGRTPPCRPARPDARPGAPRAAFRPRPRPAADIVEAAHALGLNLRYVPSMRNGAEPERPRQRDPVRSAARRCLGVRAAAGAAAASAARGDAAARRRPAARRERAPRPARAAGRRVARRAPAARRRPRTCSTAARRRPGRARRRPQPRPRPRASATWRLLHEAGLRRRRARRRPRLAAHVSRAARGWCSTTCSLRDRPARVAPRRVERLDEHPRDRGPTVFGSDHHPLLARVELHRRRRPAVSDCSTRPALVGLGADRHSACVALVVGHRRALPARLDGAGLHARHSTPSPAPRRSSSAAAALLNNPVYRGGDGRRCSRTATRSIPRCWRRSAGARDTVNFEVYIFEPDEIGRQFMDAFMERARGGRRGAGPGRRVRLAASSGGGIATS